MKKFIVRVVSPYEDFEDEFFDVTAENQSSAKRVVQDHLDEMAELNGCTLKFKEDLRIVKSLRPYQSFTLKLSQ